MRITLPPYFTAYPSLEFRACTMCKNDFPVTQLTDVKGRLFCEVDYGRFMAQVEARRKQLAAQQGNA